MKYLSIITILLAMASPAIAGEVSSFGKPFGKCQMEIQGYQQTSTWASSNGHVRIEATSACADRFGRPLELNGVSLKIFKGQKLIAEFSSPRGTYSPRQNLFLIGATNNSVTDSPIRHVQTLEIDLKKGIVRAPHGIYLNLAD